MNAPNNPRAVIGDNTGNVAERITDQLNKDYAETLRIVDDLLDQARDIPKEITDDDVMGTASKLIRAFRDTTARLKAFHTAEKEPHLRAGQAVDNFFFAQIDRCARRDRKNKPGAADVLQNRVDDFQQRKLEEERKRRMREAEEAARIAREEEAKRRKAEQEAEEARLAAERARKPERIEEKAGVAAAAEAAADAAAVDSKLAADKAQEAYVDTLAKSADIVRTRIEDGPTVTMKREGYAELVDAAQLDKETLWPFISEDAKEKALRAWAKTTGYRQPMTGAAVGFRDKTVVR